MNHTRIAPPVLAATSPGSTTPERPLEFDQIVTRQETVLSRLRVLNDGIDRLHRCLFGDYPADPIPEPPAGPGVVGVLHYGIDRQELILNQIEHTLAQLNRAI